MTPIDYCREKAAASGSSFYYSFLFLPPPKRNAITAFYAFCREVDDVVDEISDLQLARTKLAWWRTEVERAYAGTATHPVTQALVEWLFPLGIRQPQLMQIIAGMEMDLNQTRYPDSESLRLYCHRVAGIVGEISSTIFGASQERTRAYANTLGLALQLTNILRDIGDDARRGRVYLPEDAMQRHGVTRDQVLRRQASPQLTALLQEMGEQARNLYREAASYLPKEDVRNQRAGLIMGRIYRVLLDEIVTDNFAVLDRRIALTPLRKFALAWVSFVFPRGALKALAK